MSELLTIIKHMTETCALSSIDERVNGSQADSGAADLDAPLVPLERLEERICELAAHLAAGTCRFLQLVAEFDARRGWASWDLPSCAAWLAWKCQVAPGTAREQVRVARALAGLPVITGQFAAGRMSYAKARALTRIAAPATEAGLAEITGPMTAAQCERFTAAHRQASDSQELANRAARRVRVQVAEDGTVTITARLPATDGAVVLQALRAAASDCEHPHRPHPGPAEDTPPGQGTPAKDTAAAEDTPPGQSTPAKDTAAAEGTPAGAGGPAAGPDGSAGAGPGTATCRASLADALVEIAGAYLSAKVTTAGNPDIYHVIVHAGPEALQDTPAGGGSAARTGARADNAPDDSPAPRHVSAETRPDQPPAQHRVPAETRADQPPAQHRVPAETRPGQPPAREHRVPAETPGDRPADRVTGPGTRPAGHPAHPRRCHLDDGPAISPAAAAALACHATISWMLHDHDGTLLDAGRRHRRATPALRRAVRERDKSRCQYPGCHSRRTDIHHIIPWAKGGRTRLRDLILLCEAHHVIVHALGYLITPAQHGTFTFTRPDGQPMPNAPALPGSDGDLTRCHHADITTDTIIPAGLGDKLDLDLAIWASYANARIDQQTSQQPQQHQAA